MNLSTLFLLTVFSAATTQPTPLDLPVHWTTAIELGPGDLTRIDKVLAEPVDIHSDDPLLLENKLGNVRAVYTGAEYLELKAAGYSYKTNADNAKESWFKFRVFPLEYFQRARPSRQSFVSDLRLNRSPLAWLPIPLGVMHGDDRGIFIDASRDSWLDAWPKSVIKSSSDIECRIDDGEEGETYITLLAWGDFNGDGVEDVMLSVANYITTGTWKTFTVVIATRKSHAAQLEIIETKG